jgi:hypothetical protein
MSDLTDIYTAEPRLAAVEQLVEAVARRDGVVPWDAVRVLLACFVGVRRDAAVIAPHTAAVQASMPRLRDQAVNAMVGHRLRDKVASVDAERRSGSVQ